MYSVKVKNSNEVAFALTRIGKRKGKVVSSLTLQDGDLFKGQSDRELCIFKAQTGRFSVYSAWADLLGQMCVGTGGSLQTMKDIPITLLAHKNDYPQPDKESAIKTIIHARADGTYCCQNMIYYLSGQHFRITADKLRELKGKNDREWIESTQPCNCDLPLGQVKEYDGKVHEL